MSNYYWTVITISILYLSTISAKPKSNTQFLPKSINELKIYYDVIKNLEKRGVLDKRIADSEQRLYIKYASKLSGKKNLLTEEEFLTWGQRETIVSFSNIIAILAGVIVVIAATVLCRKFFLPTLASILPAIASIPKIYWEISTYIISIYMMLLVHSSWLIFIGCLGFVASISYTLKRHYSMNEYAKLKVPWICFFVWTIVAIYHQHREAGYLAVMALQTSLGFVMFVGQLCIIIGFSDESVIPRATITSFILILLGSILSLQKQTNMLAIPFARPLLFLGTFVYFIGITILSSRFYDEGSLYTWKFWLTQVIAFCSGLASMFFGSMLELPFVQAIGGTMFVFWLLEKYVEIAPKKNTSAVAASLLGFGLLLYGFAYFLSTNPQYFIFHLYSRT